MSATTEQTMLDAIRAHAADEGHTFPYVYAMEVRMVGDTSEDDPAAGRLYYRMGTAWSALAALAAPMTGCPGVADAPALRSYRSL